MNKPAVTGTLTGEVIIVKKDALKVQAPLIQQAHNLQIVTSEHYELASSLRTKIKAAKKSVVDRLDIIIRPAYEALQALYLLKKEIIDPMDKADEVLTIQMRQFKIAEAAEIEQANRAKREQEDKLRREAEAKEAAAAKARTAQMRGRLEAQAAAATEKAKEVAAAPVAAPIKATGGSTRIVKRWRCVNLQLLAKAVADGEVPDDCISINTVRMNEYFKDSPADVAAIPGIELWDDLQIVNR